MAFRILLITPPFTQLNTPYPATAYLKGFLDSHNINCHQKDLSISLFNDIFSSDFLRSILLEIGKNEIENLLLFWSKRDQYIEKVNLVMDYLRNPTTSVAHLLTKQGYLPSSHRLPPPEEELNWAFGALGVLDHAKHLCTLFIEEIGDFIQLNYDEFFSFTKYGEQIATSATSFDQIHEYLQFEPNKIEVRLLEILEGWIQKNKPALIGFTVPFPGNLFSALRCGQYIKNLHPEIKVVMGGGYCNTELRSLKDPRLFDYIDFVTLDDGEGPLLNICQYLKSELTLAQLERTFSRENNQVVFHNKLPNKIYHHSTLPTPTYKGLDRKRYVSFLDVMNPMHRLWSDGNWNKLTISHGCYWKQCSFCDVSLPYISQYENTSADQLVDKIEGLINETGLRGFHFVDEAAPPKMLKALSIALIKRKIHISWWTNIRFEKTFDAELCQLMSQSGCIAVTGGLEVASDRLLRLMKKGVDVAQVARVTNAFTEAGIMVHAYLMYGFPTQTVQETIDSLEVVRQLFYNSCIQSAFWHRFTTTIHSPVGKNPELFKIEITGPDFMGFAQNDLFHTDPTGANHELFSEGLKIALNNYMLGLGLEEKISEWFEFEVPDTTLSSGLIQNALLNPS